MKHFFESSIADLYDSTVRAFPRTTMRQHATHPIIIEGLRWTPFVGLRTLFIKAEARNEDRHYTPIILFKNVQYGSQGVKITGSDGKQYEFAKLSLEGTDVALRCNCKDFYWRFVHYNHLDKSLYGRNRSPYESKGGPPANPLELEGMCKHLIKTTKVLSEAGLFLS